MIKVSAKTQIQYIISSFLFDIDEFWILILALLEDSQKLIVVDEIENSPDNNLDTYRPGRI